MAFADTFKSKQLATSPVNGKILSTDGEENVWTDDVGVTDHGALTGLADDDHTQYHTDARGDARYLQILNDLSDLNNAGTARTNLGLVAGGTGDIWVEKAGDTMSGALNMGDNDISNVNDISLDTISSDAGTSITVNLGNDAGDDFIVGNNNTFRVTGDDDRVGIGTSAPDASLEVQTASDSSETGLLVDYNETDGTGNATAFSLDYDRTSTTNRTNLIGFDLSVVNTGSSNVTGAIIGFKTIPKSVAGTHGTITAFQFGPAMDGGTATNVKAVDGNVAINNATATNVTQYDTGNFSFVNPVIGTSIGLDVRGLPKENNTPTTAYGIRVRTQGNRATSWAFRADGTNQGNKCYIGYRLGIGSGNDTPDEALDVLGNIWLDRDDDQLIFGAGKDATIQYDGTDLIIDPDAVGSGRVLVGATGDDDMLLNDIEIDGDLNHDGSNLGFYGATPVTQPAHIVDADGTLSDITTKFNQLLADLAGQGLQASS